MTSFTGKTCLACGLESDTQVRMRLVHYPTDKVKPYAAEWRCTDLKACLARQAELAPGSTR